MFQDNFDTFDTNFWYVSDFTVAANWNQTAWEADYVVPTLGEVTLNLDGADRDGKPFTGAEIQSDDFYGYGSYEVTMQAAAGSGAVSSFFLFSSEFFGADKHNEIDFEFLGNDTTKVNINYYYGNEKLGDNGSVQIDLGFDAAAGMHDYRIDWQPDAIRWFVDGVLIYEVREDTAPLPIPDEDMKVYMNLWTGDDRLDHWHGAADPALDTEAVYSAVSFEANEPTAPVGQTGAVDFSDQSDAMVINLQEGTYAKAAKILPLGDSLTVGYVDTTDPNQVVEDLDGYRGDLLQMILSDGGWIDYVGSANNGPADQLDTDHAAVGGISLTKMTGSGTAGAADISDALAAYAPDIMLLMAGTNDFGGSESKFTNRFNTYMNKLGRAVDQFFEQPNSDQKYLVISTLAPWNFSYLNATYTSFINEGYSVVNGELVAGDAGNGTYNEGIIARVQAWQQDHPTLLLFENPVDETGLSPDGIHWYDSAYNLYASEMYAFLQAEIGFDGGTIGGTEEYLPAGLNSVVGSTAGDRIIGSDADDMIDGNGGRDLLEGGAGADTFLYTQTALDGTTDVIADFSVAEGDKINLGQIALAFGWTVAELQAALTLTDTPLGVQFTLATPTGDVTFLEVRGVTAADIAAQIIYTPLNTADDDQNLSLSAPDLFIDINEQTAVELVVSGLDADATAVLTLSDGTTDLTLNISGDGTFTFDLSGLNDGAISTSITATDAAGATITLPGPELSLSSMPPPPSADEDGNMALAVPDTLIEPGEETAVQVVLTGLDADATAIVSLSDGVTTLTAPLAADGTATFDVSTLNDGPLATSVTATDVNGHTSTVNGPGLTLAIAPDSSADEDGNLALAAPDLSIDETETGNVVINVTGIDADATAVVSITDGVTTLTSAVLTADGSVSFDVSGLNDGTLSTSVTATDGAANTATVAGPNLTLDTTTPPPPPTSSDVIYGTEGRDTIYAQTNNPTEIYGLGDDDRIYGAGGNDLLDGGAGQDRLYGYGGADIFKFGVDGLDGNRDRIYDFSIAEGDKIDLSEIAAFYGWSETDLANQISLSDSSNGLKVYLNAPEGTYNLIFIDGILAADFLAANSILATPAGSADDDGNMALSTPDTVIEPGEETSVTVTLAGLDADATADVTVSDGSNSLTVSLSADGNAVFDLSGFADGPITTSVTATDSEGNIATVSGPSITLDIAPDTSADEDGNLALAATDNYVDGTELTNVVYTVGGIDADATAVITVTDGITTLTSGTLTADGSASFDFSVFADGAITSSVTATDGTGNTATVAGTVVTLDSSAVPPEDALIGTEGADTLKDGGGAYTIYGLGGNDRLIGNGGNDTIFGGDGDDFIRGDNGDDVLDGGAGADYLRGSAGADTFVFGVDGLDGETDTINSFSSAEGDLIDLSGIVAHYGWTQAEAESHVAFSAASGDVNVTLDTPDLGVLTLAEVEDIALSDISYSDFIFV
ncbi:family 16 glycosylhydrolase [Actibacterium ureilyticum]|uniref:family 16 glycosylhydrolase n=1 Tax=Actibacterium ureilyticum TaxID=1590614 RepID=UPI000BAB03E7|nr:family 16 glycosylhydrolase [Actibacterium ureilyticum]